MLSLNVEKVKEILASKNENQVDLAIWCNVTRQCISLWFKNPDKVPLHQINKISKVVNKHPFEILTWNG